jgi:hypothetical protein
VTINIRQKGAEGEREIAKILNAIICDVMRDMNWPQDKIDAAITMVQRNQNQSAVGGNDLSNTFGMSIEVKRQEQLAVNTWWAQCVAAAERNNELPVLMWRQNRKPWRIRSWVWLSQPTPDGAWGYRQIAADFDMDEFKSWFRTWVNNRLLAGYEVKV